MPILISKHTSLLPIIGKFLCLSPLEGRLHPKSFVPCSEVRVVGAHVALVSHHAGLSACVWCLLTRPPFALSPALTNRTHGCLTSDCPPGSGPSRLRAEVSPLWSWQLHPSPQEQACEQCHERAVPGCGWGQPRGLGEGRPLSPPHQDGVWLSLPQLEPWYLWAGRKLWRTSEEPKSTAQVKELNLASWLFIYVLFTVVNCLKLSFLVN